MNTQLVIRTVDASTTVRGGRYRVPIVLRAQPPTVCLRAALSAVSVRSARSVWLVLRPPLP